MHRVDEERRNIAAEVVKNISHRKHVSSNASDNEDEDDTLEEHCDDDCP